MQLIIHNSNTAPSYIEVTLSRPLLDWLLLREQIEWSQLVAIASAPAVPRAITAYFAPSSLARVQAPPRLTTGEHCVLALVFGDRDPQELCIMQDTERTARPTQNPRHLDHDELAQSHAETLAAPRRHYSLAARLLFAGLDIFYGRARTLEKFRVLELIARVPYQAWEQVAYVATTHVHEHGELARRVYDRVLEARAQQDNEQWHLFILDELIASKGSAFGRLRTAWLPQLIAFLYYQISWLLYVVSPAWSYRLNADFEDHAEHEYAALVVAHPEWETASFNSQFATDYGRFVSLADLFRQISYDERCHKRESEAKISIARFSARE